MSTLRWTSLRLQLKISNKTCAGCAVIEARGLFGDCSVKGFEYNGYEIVALWTFDLFKRLNVFLLRTVHNRENFCYKM